MYLYSILNILLLLISPAFASLNLNQTNNLAVYWGQNSGSRTGPNAQGPLSQTCEDADIDVVLLAFLVATNNKNNVPELNFANQQGTCDETSQPLNCSKTIGTDIAKCQAKGKTVLISIGGEKSFETGYSSIQDARAGAEKIWAMFGPRKDSRESTLIRPFGGIVVDGFDLDFEGALPQGQHLGAFGQRLRELMSSASSTDRKFYLSAAPQCSGLGYILAEVPVDFWFIQFYNNPSCTYGGSSKPNFAQWNTWATENKTKMFVGLPADPSAVRVGNGYVPPASLSDFLKDTKGLSNMAGVSLWDANQAFVNNNYHRAVKTTLNEIKPSS
jgi:chitinase